VALIVGSVFLLLLVGLGAGWMYFRRMLMPQGAPNPNLPPSGAGPWSRDRMSNPNSMGGFANMQGGQDFMNGNGYGGFNPQGDPGMLPPGSGAFPGMAGANGFAPSSQDFNAMYGMPGGDPFSPPQGGPPGYGGPPPNGGNFPAGGPTMMQPNQPGSPNSNWVQ
jgi:hypothetical protein